MWSSSLFQSARKFHWTTTQQYLPQLCRGDRVNWSHLRKGEIKWSSSRILLISLICNSPVFFLIWHIHWFFKQRQQVMTNCIHCSVVGLVSMNTPYFTMFDTWMPELSFTCYTKWWYVWLIYWIIAIFKRIVQWTANNGTYNLPHTSHHSTAGCSHSIEVQTVTAYMEAMPNNTWNVWMLQEMRLPFNFPPFVFHNNVLHHFLSQSPDLTNLLEHFDNSIIITVKQRDDLISSGLATFTWQTDFT
jgi:hypothetical protein